MAKFIKLKLNGLPKGDCDDIQWRMVIDTVEDLEKYHSFNATQNMEAFMTLERDERGTIKLSHPGAAPTRTIILQKLLHTKINTTPEHEKVYPILEVAQITDKKYLGMLRHLTSYGPIQMNEAGGYCGLDDFIATWNAEVLEEIQTDSFGFPVNDAPLQADTLILENSHKEYVGTYMESTARKDVLNAGNIQTIYNLREVDSKYLAQCIALCKNIVIQTELQDNNQLTQFMGLFRRIERKNIYLYVSNEVEKRIRSHPEFDTNTTIHNIVFK